MPPHAATDSVSASPGDFTPATASTESSPEASRRRLVILLTLGICGGLAGGFAVEKSYNSFAATIPEGLAGNGIYTAEQLEQLRAERVRADYWNTPLAIGLLGLMVGASLGSAQAIASRGSRGAIVAGAATGGLAGLFLGAIGGWVAVFSRELLSGWSTLDATGQPHPLANQLHSMAVQLPSWIAIATAVGLAVYGSTRQRPLLLRATGMSIAAVLLASLLYPTVAALIFSMDDPGGVIPSGLSNRVFWAVLYAGMISVLLSRLPSKSTSVPGVQETRTA
jgi:hypothetical protein